MRRHSGSARPRAFVTATLIALTTFALAAIPKSADAADELVAEFRDGTLSVIVPTDIVPSGVPVSLDVLDPEDKVVAHYVRPPAQRSGTLRATLAIGRNVPLEDLAWNRLRIGTGQTSRIVSLSEILRIPVVRVFAQKAYAAGSLASVRVVAVDGRNGHPLSASGVRIDLVGGGATTNVFSGRTDGRGTVQADFRLAPGAFGARTLAVTATTPLGTVVATHPVQLERRDRILLTTDKPLYQPGQVMNLRALALDGPTRRAVSAQPIVLEVEDAKGNKVFKQRGRTDAFGIASAQFELAEEVNFGPYHVRAILGDGDTTSSQEKTVTVDRYVLPKFKVDVELGTDAAKAQASYFAPGDTVTGSVSARYHFGKPLVGADVVLTMTTFDVQSVEIGRVTGKTDAEGRFEFATRLPDFLAGRSTQQGSAPVSIGVDVKDTANHVETKSRDILVSKEPITVMAIPESGELLPGLDNRVFVLTSYPDGTPAETTLAGNIVPASAKTDAGGVAVITLRGGKDPVTLALTATDGSGRTTRANLKLEPRAQSESLMLRTDRALYKVGDDVRIDTVSTRQRGPVYVDVVRDGQTLVTRAIDTNGGRGALTLDLTAEMYGMVEIRAYQITSDADPIVDRRLVYVDPADDLRVRVAAERESYKPGDDARIDFTVTDAAGRPVSAALGVEIVDEAVFALSQKQPGFEKVFMYLQKELLTPRYEVHQFTFDRVVLDDPDEPKPVPILARERAAQVLLAAAGTVRDRDVKVVAGREQLESKRAEYAGRYAARVYESARAVAEGLVRYYGARHPAPEGFGRDVELYAATSAGAADSLVDPWGNPLVGEGTLSPAPYSTVSLRSHGPDGRARTADDLTVVVAAQRQRVARTPRTAAFRGVTSTRSDSVTGGRVTIEGTATDDSGTPLSGVRVAVLRVSSGKTTSVYTDARGRFTVAGLAPGTYHVRFESDGTETTVFKAFTLVAGDAGIVEARLSLRGPTPILLSVSMPYADGDDVAFLGGMGAADKLEMRPRARVNVQAAKKEGRRAQAPLAAPMDMAANEAVEVTAGEDLVQGSGGDREGGPRVRSYFPETLYVNPALLTDGSGRASIRVPLADSITTWRVTTLASTAAGALGSTSSPVRVFQDFFVDLDLPVAVTEGDSVSVPVAVYNYLAEAHRVALEIRQDPWFALENDVPTKHVDVAAGEVTVAYFRIKAGKIGDQQLQVTATLDGSASKGDAVARQLAVAPNGEERAVVVNERIEGPVSKEIVIPEDAIPDASKIFVKLYPGALSQVVEGLDSMLRMPSGCFEQTSSTTYPNILVMDYLKTSKKLTPEIQAKAEGFISLGYQRLVTFEVDGGGFSWFGQAPANKILTSYGLMEFADMARVHEVDPRLIERTQRWLASQQQPDGSFRPDANFINEGATNRYNTDVTRITAYIGWALATTGYKGGEVEKARQYVASHVTGREDAYTLAVIANFASDSGLDRAWTDASIAALAAKVTEDQKSAFWKQEGETPTYARDDSADLETTALAVQALLKSGQRGALAKKGLDYLTSKKDAFGNWQSTQATILALKAFVLSFTKGANADTAGAVEVSVDGTPVDRIEITRENNDLLHLVDLKAYTRGGAHKIGLAFSGQGSMQYQIVGRYYVPWVRRADAPREPLSIEVAYDRARLAQDESVTAKVRVRNNTPATAKMIMVDLGIPPGFEPSGADFAALVDATRGRVGGKLEKYTITAKQIILYFDALTPNQSIEFSFGMRAKFPVRAQSFSSRVYEYYNPTVEDKTKPVELTIVSK
jgi:uncharacterized protein YfaS (alpha-2-macroglobulin family)